MRYIIALINVTNPEQYQEYAKRAAPVSAKQGGPYLVRSAARDMEGALTELEAQLADGLEEGQ
jgi:uncharacterized protein (DUF1330 family)